MKEFLANLRPPKFLRYLFYIAYSGYRRYKSDREDAHVMATILLATFSGVSAYGLLLWHGPEKYKSLDKYQSVLPFVTLVGLLFYYFFIYRSKWRYYIEEFKHLKRKQRRIGLIYLFIYLFMCFVIAFYPIVLEDVFGIEVIEKKIPEPIIEKEFLRY